MGNLSFIVPTKNKENFNIEFISNLINYQLNFNVDNYSEFEQLSITTDFLDTFTILKGRLIKDVKICDIFFNQECYILNFEKDLKYLQEMIKENKKYEEFFVDLKKLEELKPNLKNCLHITYGQGMLFKERNRILNLLKNHFYAYIFDEGIHPEFMSPNFQFKEENL